jgi:N-methylhydantoinase B
MYSGYDSKGEWYQLFQIGFGGIPGRAGGDGPDGHSLWPGFTNVPNEYIEAYFPLRIEVYETISDSGGAGYNRGGNGIRMAYRFLEDGQISIHDDRWLTYPWGVNGGAPGERGTKRLVRADGSEQILPSKCDRIAVMKGDLLYFNTWGGGGVGDPLTRELDRVKTDVISGLVTVEGATRYGVVLDTLGNINQAATTSLRNEMAANRKELPLFDFGGTIEEIKARCLEETGMEPPTQPVFANQPG